MKELILYTMLASVLFSACKKEVETSRLENLHGDYTYSYSFEKNQLFYDMSLGEYYSIETDGTESKQIEIIKSPYSEKEFVIIGLIADDSTYVYWPVENDTFIVMSNTEYFVDASGSGYLDADELHININLRNDNNFSYNELKGVAVRN